MEETNSEILNVEFTVLITLISINTSNEDILVNLWNMWGGWEVIRLHRVDRSHIQDKNEVYPIGFWFYFINITIITMKETNGEIFLRTCTKHEDIGSTQSPRGNKDSHHVQKWSPSCVAFSLLDPLAWLIILILTSVTTCPRNIAEYLWNLLE